MNISSTETGRVSILLMSVLGARTSQWIIANRRMIRSIFKRWINVLEVQIQGTLEMILTVAALRLISSFNGLCSYWILFFFVLYRLILSLSIIFSQFLRLLFLNYKHLQDILFWKIVYHSWRVIKEYTVYFEESPSLCSTVSQQLCQYSSASSHLYQARSWRSSINYSLDF